jgi:pimeloyl-ACP methyl ester carboxylesterase
MRETVVPTSYVEFPVYFDAGENTLFGILTVPRDRQADTGFIILTGAGTPFTVNRNRLSVRLCRELSALGYAGFRLDYHGVGESTGSVGEFRLDRPFVRDVTAAVEVLARQGINRVILAGSCFGARNALCAAAELDNVDAVILIAGALRNYVLGERNILGKARQWSLARYVREALRAERLRGLFHRPTRRVYLGFLRGKFRHMAANMPGIRRMRRTRPSTSDEIAPNFDRSLRRLVDRGVTVRFIYGQNDGFYRDEFLPAMSGSLADVLGDRSGTIELVVVPGRLHGFTSVAAQDIVVEDIVNWAATRRSSGEPAGADGSARARPESRR